MNKVLKGVRSIGGMLIMIVGLKSEAEGALSLRPALSVSERYDDNLFFSQSDREADFTSMVIPGIDLFYSSRDFIFSGRYESTAEFHVRHPEENRWSQTLSLSANFPVLPGLKGGSLQIREAVTYAPERAAFAFGGNGEVAPGNFPADTSEGIHLGRTDSFRNQAGVSFNYDWSPRSAFTAAYSNSLTRFKAPGLQDFDVHDATLQESYRWSPRMRGYATYGLSVIDYEGADRVTNHRATAGCDLQLNAGTSVGGEAGVSFLEGEGTHLTLNSRLSQTLKSGSFLFQYRHGVGTGGGATTGATLTDQLSAQATHSLSRPLSFHGRIGYGRNRTVSGSLLEITTYEAGGGIRVGLLSWLAGSVDYSYTSQRVQGSGGVEAERNRVMATLSATSLPIRFQ